MIGPCGRDPPAMVYAYAPGWGGEHLGKLLVNCRGISNAAALRHTRSCRRTGSQSPSAEESRILPFPPLTDPDERIPPIRFFTREIRSRDDVLVDESSLAAKGIA